MELKNFKKSHIIFGVIIIIVIILLVINCKKGWSCNLFEGMKNDTQYKHIIERTDPNHPTWPSGLNSDNIDNAVKRNEDVLTLYYTDWCPHCLQFKPLWEKFAESGVDIKMKALDCEQNRSLCERNPNVKGFPTVILHKKDGNNVLFRGDRTVLGLKNFVVQNKS